MSTSRLYLAILAAGLLAPVVSSAQGLPDPRFSTLDPVVVGNASGTHIAPFGGSPGYDVVVRDVNSAPLPGRVVTLDFSATTMKLYAVQNAGTTLDCAARSISRVTNSAGAVNFAARVAGHENTNAIHVRLDNGELLGSVKGRSTDMDGIDGTTGLGDFALFAANYNSTALETDFDENGITGLGDYAIIAREFANGSTGSYCP